MLISHNLGPNWFLSLSACGTKQILFQHPIVIVGQNNKPPVFNQPSYEAQISKQMPPEVPIHFIDESFVITAVDNDFVAPEPLSDDTSNNIVTKCIVEGDEENAIKCEVREKENGGLFRGLQ